jgi:hypothetical protein
MGSEDATVALMERINQMVDQLRRHIEELRAETENGRHEPTATVEGDIHE